MKASDGTYQVMSLAYTGSNMKSIIEMVVEHSRPSMGILGENERGEEYLLTANPVGDAMEEYPQEGDVYAVHLDTQEIFLFTAQEFDARFKLVD